MTISSLEEIDVKTIKIVPAPMSVKAGKSYFQFNSSPRHLTERKVFHAIANILTVETRTRSINGRVTTLMTVPRSAIRLPKINFPLL